MNNRIRPALAAAAVVALAATAGTAAPAHAGGDRHGDGDGYDVTIPLTARVSDELRDGNNGVIATGKAEKWQNDERIVLSFPVRWDRDHHRTGDGDRWTALAGGVEFTGSGVNVTWESLKVGGKGFVSAVLGGGDRANILRIAGDRHDGHHRGGGSAKLVLTDAGAASLNRAAAGAPFSAGDVFAGGNDCGDHR